MKRVDVSAVEPSDNKDGIPQDPKKLEPQNPCSNVQACLLPDLEGLAKANPSGLPLLDSGVAALYEPLRLLKADLCLNPTRFQSWERLASAHVSILPPGTIGGGKFLTSNRVEFGELTTAQMS